MAFLIGRGMSNENACGIMAWETAEAMSKMQDPDFMNISQQSGEELYKAARSKTNIVFQKALDNKSKPSEDAIVDVYLPHYTNKVVVHGNSIEKFLGHYSLATTVQPFAAGIIFIKTATASWSTVLCVASGENRPTYIFDANKGTLERTENLYHTIFDYVQNTTQLTLSAYIVSTEGNPIVFEEKVEEKQVKKKGSEKRVKEKDATPKKKDTKRAKKDEVHEAEPAKEKDEDEESEKPKTPKGKSKKRVKEEEDEDEESEKPKTPKGKSKKRVKEDETKKDDAPSPKKRVKESSPEDESDATKQPAEEEKPRKKGPVRRRRLAQVDKKE